MLETLSFTDVLARLLNAKGDCSDTSFKIRVTLAQHRVLIFTAIACCSVQCLFAARGRLTLRRIGFMCARIIGGDTLKFVAYEAESKRVPAARPAGRDGMLVDSAFRSRGGRGSRPRRRADPRVLRRAAGGHETGRPVGVRGRYDKLAP
jgi:hypothetical protein